MTTETIDKLYLELSQVSTAKTAREAALERSLQECLNRLETIRETHPTIHLDDTIQRGRELLPNG